MSLALVDVYLKKTTLPVIIFYLIIGLIVGGTIGNLIDRISYGYVIDFIDAHYNQYHWPVFNLADSFIFIGVALILFERRPTSK